MSRTSAAAGMVRPAKKRSFTSSARTGLSRASLVKASSSANRSTGDAGAWIRSSSAVARCRGKDTVRALARMRVFGGRPLPLALFYLHFRDKDFVLAPLLVGLGLQRVDPGLPLFKLVFLFFVDLVMAYFQRCKKVGSIA